MKLFGILIEILSKFNSIAFGMKIYRTKSRESMAFGGLGVEMKCSALQIFRCFNVACKSNRTLYDICQFLYQHLHGMNFQM